MSDTGLRIEIALRAARLAKSVLELVGLEPAFVRLQLSEIADQVREIDHCIAIASAKGGRT